MHRDASIMRSLLESNVAQKLHIHMRYMVARLLAFAHARARFSISGCYSTPDELDDFESHGPTLLKRRRRGDDERSLALRGLEISFDGSGESDAPHSSPCHRPPGSPGNPLDVPVSPVRSP